MSFFLKFVLSGKQKSISDRPARNPVSRLAGRVGAFMGGMRLGLFIRIFTVFTSLLVIGIETSVYKQDMRMRRATSDLEELYQFQVRD